MTENLVALLHQSARTQAERHAVVAPGHMVTYQRLAEQVDRLAATLHAHGLGGRRVGLMLPNLPVFPLALYGLLRAGGVAVMLNPLNSRREVREHLEQASADAVLTTAALAELLPGGSRALLVDQLPERLLIREMGTDAAPEARPVPVEGTPPPLGELPAGDRPAAILFTAADRGWARGAVLSHRNLVANVRSTLEAMQLGPGDRIAAALPLIHAFGLTVSLNAGLGAGATVLPVERFHPLRLLDAFHEHRITVFAGVPAMYAALLQAVERRGVPDHALRLVIAGGAPLDEEIGRHWEQRFGVELRQGYGLTEAAPVCAFNRTDRPNHPGTLGYPFPGVEAAVLGPDGTPLAADEVGELCVRGDNVFLGYLDGGRDPASFHGEWLRTGDLASIDAGGVIRFRGVLKPMFTRNGFNIYPRELERVLEADPRVAGARVYSQPDPVRENDVVVAVLPAPGAELDADAVAELCRRQFAAYKQPTRIDLVDALPG